jgi:hypothetical protein
VAGVVFASIFAAELGVRVPSSSWGYDYDEFWEDAEARDILDAITVVYRVLQIKGHNTRAKSWCDTIARIFREENVGYRLDEEAGVHFALDQEFEISRAATVAGLGRHRYAAASKAFQEAHSALDRDPPDGRSAIRHTFDALETVFKLSLGNKVSRLGAIEIEKHLRPIALENHSGAARNAASAFMSSFVDWVNACHHYRHAEGIEQPEQPPMSVTVLAVSTGASFLRWLVELDNSPSSVL